MLIDSHCHLPKNNSEAEAWLQNAAEVDVTKLINIGTSTSDTAGILIANEKYKNVFGTVAIYPHEDRDKSLEELKSHLAQAVKNPKIVAIGECGIDISNWENGRPVEEQLPLFKMQIELALENNLPIVIHNRNGDDLVIKTLQEYPSRNLKGVAHCFASSWEVAQQYLELGFYISFSGFITYPSRKELLDTVKNVPLDRFLVETDAPYLPPQGHRGEKNEPKYVKIVAQKIAEVRGISFENVSEASFENTCRVFGLNKD